jgi:GPH family glycoside/pentoside/hexuronide:cation symporter
MVLSVVVKAFDGLVGIPLSSFTDNLRTRWGRRRPAILIGYIPLLVAYVLFLIPLEHDATLLNTVYFAALLGIFYSGYTLSMVTYYATFAEIVDSESDRIFLSTVKSVCDVVYFSLNFALVPLFISLQINIRMVALIFLPLALTMLIPLFMIKESSTKEGIVIAEGCAVQTERVGFITSLRHAFRNKSFLFWLCIVAVMNVGLQLFLGGISVFFSGVGEHLNMTFVMASSFVPVPFTLLLYNNILKRRGLRFAFCYILLVFSLGMSLMMVCPVLPVAWQLPWAILCAVIVSFAIGAFFSITYTVPSQMAAEENKRGVVCASTMYFAVQGLFEAISASFATQVVLILVRPVVGILPVVVSSFTMLAFLLACFLPKNIAMLGKQSHQGDEVEK